MSNEKFKVKFGLAVGDTVATVDGTTGDIVTSGDIAVNGGDITTTSTTANVVNTTATTVNIGGAATTVSIGANTGTTTINNSLVADDISVTTVDTTNLEVTNIKAKDGTAAAVIADSTGIITVSTQLNVDNLNLSGNTISSTDTNGSITLDPNGTGNVVMTFANGGNLTNDRNYVLGTIRQTAAASAGDVWGFGTGTTSPYRGISLDNYLTSTTVTGKRSGIVMRNYGAPPRNSIITESARGTNPSVPLAPVSGVPLFDVQSGGYCGISNGTGFTSTGSSISGTTLTIGTLVTGTIAVGQLISGGTTATGTTITANISGSGSGSTWTVSSSQTVSSSSIIGGGDGFLSSTNTTGGAIRLNTAENWSNTTTGTQFQVALSGLASGSPGSSFNSILATSSGFTAISDSFNFTGYTNGGSSGQVSLGVNQRRSSGGNSQALVNFSTVKSTDGVNFTPTLINDQYGQFKFNGNAYTGTSFGVPSGPGASITATATENWSGFTSTGSSISGTTLTIGTINSGGTVAVNQTIYGTGITTGTRIIANISGSGSGSTWTVDISQTVGPIAIIGGANGSQFTFQTVRNNTLDSYNVIAGNTNSLAFNSDTVNINSFDSLTNRVSVDSSAARFNLPILLNGSSSGYITVQAGSTPAVQTYTLPQAYPSANNQVLVSTTGGAMSWVNSASIAANYLNANYTSAIGTQTANTIYGVPLTSVAATNISIATGTVPIDDATSTGPTRITIAQVGKYNLQFSLQMVNSDNGDVELDIWFRKNGTDIANSNTQFTVKKKDSANTKFVPALNFILDATSVNDYFELIYAVSNAGLKIEQIASQSSPYVRPAAPGVIVTVVPVGA